MFEHDPHEHAIRDTVRLRDTYSRTCRRLLRVDWVPGYLAGLYHAGDQTIAAHGLAKVVTGAPMRVDTGFLFGSITKIMTTTSCCNRWSAVSSNLDERVLTYPPQFELTTPCAAEQIRVRHLLTHTNGIDADLFLVDTQGRDAPKIFLDRLAQSCARVHAAGVLGARQ